jgi:hypothetical protein
MDNNTGSFAGVLGNTPALQQAIARRGNTGGATNAVSQSSANFNPNAQPPAPVTSQSPSATGTPSPTPGAGSGLPIDSGEATIILKSMAERLKSLSKMAGV